MGTRYQRQFEMANEAVDPLEALVWAGAPQVMVTGPAW